MTKVAMIVSNRYDPDPRVHKEAMTLATAGYLVTIYAFDRMHEMREQETLENGVKLVRLRVKKSPMGNLIATGMGLRSFRSKVKKHLLKNPPDVVHCHDQDTCSLGVWWKFFGKRLAGKNNSKFVFDAHDLYWTWLRMPDPDSTWRKAGAQVLKAQAFGYAKAADLLITVTEGTQKYPGVAEVFRQWGIHTEVIWNAPEAPESVPPLPEQFTIGYIGNVRESIMFTRLIDAIEKLAPKERPAVLVAGAGVAANEVKLMLQDASIRLNFPVEVTGSFSMNEIPALQAKTSIQYCMYPGERGQIARSAPVKMFESLAFGRPVIGNANTLFGDLIVNNNWGVCAKEGDSNALAESIRIIKKNLSISNNKNLNVGQRVWSKEGKKLLKLYEGLCA